MNGTLFGNSAPATARRTPTLRPYQVDFMNQGRALMGAGHRMIVMQMATGGGKGTVSAAMFHAAVQKGKRCLFFGHRKKLVTQKGDRLDQYGVPYTILMPGHRFDSSCPVVVASKDTLLSRAFRSSRMGLPPADMVLVDECHAATSPEYLELLSRYKGAYIVGMSATPADPDGNGLGKYGYTGLATAISTSRLVKEGHLVPVKAFHPEGVEKARRGKKARGKTKLAGDPVRHWLDYAAGRPTVLFAGRVEYSKGLVAKFNAAGIPAEHMDGSTPEDDREAMIERVEAGVTKILSNCAVLTVGVDIPCLSCIQIVKTMGSYIDYAQACLDTQTEVLARRGWVTHESIEADDEVASFDPASGGIEWGRPEGVFVRPMASGEKMFAISSPHLDVRVTGNHTMIYRCAGKDAKNWRKQEAESLSGRPSQWKIPVAGLEDASGVPLSDDELRFIGWFMTDGTLNKANKAIVISQSASSPYIEDIHKCLRWCGFKYGVYRQKRKGEMAKYADGLVFSISRGLPHGRDKHLTGWQKLERYIDKDFPATLENMTTAQLEVMLEAMFAGNGFKQRTVAWTPKVKNICTGNKIMAERLQSLCVRRGYRCNISVSIPTPGSWGKKPLYILRFKKQNYGMVGSGTSEEGRCRLSESPPVVNEKVWCMTTKHGTLVTRRNGKVAIVGNCGRVMRPFPGKEFAVILDHSGAVDRHGFPDEDTEWSLDYDGTIEERNRKAKKDGKRREPIVCPRCACLFSGTTTCPNCHHELPTNRKKESVLTQSELLVECQRGEAAKSTVESQLARACTEWSKFVRIAAHKGRTVGMASVMFRSLFKCWPEKYPGLGERLRGGPWRLPDGWQMRHPAMDVYGHAVKGGGS